MMDDSSLFCPVPSNHRKHIAKARNDCYCTNVSKTEQKNGNKVQVDYMKIFLQKKKKIQNLNYSNISEEHVKILSLKLGTLKGIQAFCSVKHYHTNLKVNKTKTPRSYKCYL